MQILDATEFQFGDGDTFDIDDKSLEKSKSLDSESHQRAVSNVETTSPSRFKRFFKKSPSTGDIVTLDTKLTTRKGKIFSHRSKLGLQEFAEFAASFFKTGWNLSKYEMVKALSFTSKYYSKYHAQELTHDKVLDSTALKVAIYWLNYSIAAYGAILINWCGHGKGFLSDHLKSNANKKTACHHLSIRMDEMLVWEFDGSEMFKPSFFISHDSKTNSIVLSIRGTWSIQDTLTDFCAEYEPFKGGFVHTGFQRGANWIISHYNTQIFEFIHKYKANALYIVGHSLGGAIASLYTLAFEDTAACIRKSNPLFTYHCYNFGAPSVCSINLANSCNSLIDSFVNENDIIPRLSYGSASDLKELVKSASSILKTKSSEQDKMEALDKVRIRLNQATDHPKTYIAGSVHYIYKESRSTPVLAIGCRDQSEKAGEYSVERGCRKYFTTMQLKNNFLMHHAPDKYEHGLRRAIDRLDAMK